MIWGLYGALSLAASRASMMGGLDAPRAVKPQPRRRRGFLPSSVASRPSRVGEPNQVPTSQEVGPTSFAWRSVRTDGEAGGGVARSQVGDACCTGCMAAADQEPVALLKSSVASGTVER